MTEFHATISMWLKWKLPIAIVINAVCSYYTLLLARRYERLNALMVALCLQAFELRGFPLLHLLREATRKERR